MDFTLTIWSLLPPVIAIVLALITKEVYSSLFIGILCGGLLYTGFNPVATMEHVFTSEQGMIGQLTGRDEEACAGALDACQGNIRAAADLLKGEQAE